MSKYLYHIHTFDFVEEIATSTSSTMDNDHNSAQLDHNSKDFLQKSVESLFNKLYGMCKLLINYMFTSVILYILLCCLGYAMP